jgi:hypothetical protein
MTDDSSPFQFDDIPLDEARRMSRAPRMEPMLYGTLRQKIQSLSTEAVRIHLGPEIGPQRMKRYLQAIARELNVPVTVRRVPGGVIFWRSSEEDVQQAQEAASRLRGRQQQETTQRRPQTRPRGRQPRGNPLGVHTPTRMSPEAIRRQRVRRVLRREDDTPPSRTRLILLHNLLCLHTYGRYHSNN